MRDLVESFLVQLSAKFAAGDVDGVQADLSMPCAIYFGTDLILLSNREDVARFTRAYMQEMGDKGLAKARLRIDDLDISEEGKITVFATAPMVDDLGAPVALGRTKYFLRHVDGALKVEMAEHAQVPLDADLIHAPLAGMAI